MCGGEHHTGAFSGADTDTANLVAPSCNVIAAVAEWVRAWDTLTMFEATVCGRS